MREDLRTKNEKMRDIDHDRIVNEYLKYRSNPACAKWSDYRIFDAIAKDESFRVSTAAGIRQVLIKKQVYMPKR